MAHVDMFSPLVTNNINQVSGTLLGGRMIDSIEETKDVPESILEQEAWENAQEVTDFNNGSTLAEIEAFTANVLQQDIDAFENQIEVMALDVGIAFDNLTGNGSLDFMYAMSMAFLFVVTFAIAGALYSYKQSKLQQFQKMTLFFAIVLKQPTKGGQPPPSIFNRRPNQPAAQNNNPQPADPSPAGLLDFMTSPFTTIQKATNTPANPTFASASNQEISRMSLHYSSANMSEEESSSLINILDRKKYHERLSATRSADEQIQPR